MLAFAALMAASIITTLNYHVVHAGYQSHSTAQHRGVYRLERTAAVWGDAAPDYSGVHLESTEGVFLYALLFVDLKISDYYRRDPVTIKAEVMKLAQEANKYFYQVGVHLVIVDVIESWRNDLSLYSFEEYRNKRIHELPYHNFAALLSYRYAGGLAFVNGMCSIKSVMLSGFYPHHPEAMGSILFHEVSHLVGVPHTPFNQTLNVPNCACEQNLPDPQDFSQPVYRPRSDLGPGVENNDFSTNSSINIDGKSQEPKHHYTPLSSGCLRIPGFDHNCTLQLMANLLWRNRCLLREPYNGLNEHMRRVAVGEEARKENISTIPLCGNGHREEGEECDCGLERSCWLANCDPERCTRLMPQWIVWVCLIAMMSVMLMAASAAYHYHLLRRRITKFPYVKSNDRFDVFGRVVELLDDHLVSMQCNALFGWRYSRGIVVRLLPSGRALKTLRTQNMNFASQRGGLQGAPMSPLSLRGTKLDASSIVVIRSPSSCRSPTMGMAHRGLGRAKRPSRPPPPPPPSITIAAVTMPRLKPSCAVVAIHNQSSTLPRRPTMPPPPHPSTIPVHSHDSMSRVETGSEECHHHLKKPFGTVLGRLRSPSSPSRVEEDRFSISHKFADFDDDDDFDSDFDENFATQDS